MRIFCLLFTLLFSHYGWSYSTGNSTQTLATADPQRPLTLRLFWPSTSTAAAQTQAANAVFEGFTAIADAPLAAGKFPLVILTHGSGGNNSNLAWLATQLAARGMIVVAANHPGSTTGDSHPDSDITRQTRDISNLLDVFLSSKQWSNAIDRQKIGVIGHSKGGYSALALAGGKITRQRYVAYCAAMPQMPDCQFLQRGKVDLQQLDSRRLEASYRDPRVKFVIALDPAMAYVLTPQSLATIKIPVLVVAAGYYIRAAQPLHLGVEQLPLPQQKLPGAGHYDFLPLCQPRGEQILAEEGEAFICETPAAQRRAIHQQVSAMVLGFLQQHAIITD
ncbi:alpha/beta hydrolase family protein [Pantoea sp. B65]|uniref:alpha/beta hydrolase family protein n=1 Tax=Pantoea sp. B65 TaxID=2813359 RepID=UPI0039B534F2